ncbi:hypothetical protein [Nostoc parmelioides]|uniref:Uncharacterized protein n=1 Tax=Nostoc parmelioides FACHB-3921 TaxID=2692909 RepID=A0ABR8BLM1_9NOSO|nr:hypothetical protein [Nostoc parmelioides]MBD2254793.1 hypothetical protein [Nostoc parmelioides FACHB-3921]
MPYTKEALQNMYALSAEDVNATLEVCGLPVDKEEYGDEEIAAVDFQQAVELVKQQNSDTSSTPENDAPEGKKKRKSKPLDTTELLAKARDKGIKLSLLETMQVLQSCGLSEKDEYSQAECDRFLEAGDLIKKQSKSVEEVAQHFGLSTNDSMPEADVDTDALLQELGDTTALLGEEERELIREMVRQKAKGDMAGLPKLYLQSLLEEMRSPQFQQEWQQLREAFKAKVMGKKQTSPIFPLQPPLMSLPPTSENGSISE